MHRLDLEVPRGEVHCLCGTSGSGKTTVLRLINRLERPTGGQVLVDGRDVAAVEVHRHRRGIGYVIQSGGLFPHLNVAQNIGLLCRLEGHPRAAVERRVRELLELVALSPDEFAARFPQELSGGQRQRVGIARALALDPPCLLMDEPFGALDPITRVQLHDEFERLFRKLGKTVMLVTHDLDEAFRLGHRVTLLDGGHLQQTGAPDELLQRPANDFVAAFVRDHRGRSR
ncbi:MAG: ATP-binding cassette domain-containing protein [Planctomycetes bacterium]|nr:ATP-binding cassette domain-containing protein [Planctomycetota bacterium]